MIGISKWVDVKVGDRVEIGLWVDCAMMGDRFGVVTWISKRGRGEHLAGEHCKVKCDRSGKVRRVHRGNIAAVIN